MTLNDVCDVVYALLIEKLERQVLAELQVVAVLMAAGQKGLSWPTIDERRAALDAALIAVPQSVDSEQQQLRRALGVSA